MNRMWAWLRKLLRTALILVALLDYQLAIAKDVSLSWDPSPTTAVTGYTVEVSHSAVMFDPILLLDAGNVLTLTLYGLGDTDDHWFCVKAYDDLGNISACSNIVHSQPVEEEPPPEVPEPVLPILEFEVTIEILK